MSDPSSEMARAIEILDGATEVAISCHINPDGDALGSALALHHLLRERGVRTMASYSDPFVLSRRFVIFPGTDALVAPDAFPLRPEVMVTFDCGSADRLGTLQPAAGGAGVLINVDHHISNTRFGSVNVVDPDAAASAQVLYAMAHEAGWKITRDAAYCLYVGLVTDTGRFQYRNTTPAVFEMAADLARHDLPIDTISRTLFAEDPFGYLKLLGTVMAHAELDEERRLVTAVVRQVDLAAVGIGLEDTDGLIDDVRRAAEADVACVVKEQVDGTAKVSLRSTGPVDVCAVATAAGGGGHRLAAGFTFEGGPDDAIRFVKEQLAGA